MEASKFCGKFIPTGPLSIGKYKAAPSSNKNPQDDVLLTSCTSSCLFCSADSLGHPVCWASLACCTCPPLRSPLHLSHLHGREVDHSQHYFSNLGITLCLKNIAKKMLLQTNLSWFLSDDYMAHRNFRTATLKSILQYLDSMYCNLWCEFWVILVLCRGISHPASTRTLVPSLVPGRVVELQVDVPVLPRLCPALAVASGFVRFVIDLRAERMGELLGAASALFAKEVLLAEVFPKVFVITGKRKEAELPLSPCICWETVAVTDGMWLLYTMKWRQAWALGSLFAPRQVFQLKPLVYSRNKP